MWRRAEDVIVFEFVSRVVGVTAGRKHPCGPGTGFGFGITFWFLSLCNVPQIVINIAGTGSQVIGNLFL